jgi:hypothetical protein
MKMIIDYFKFLFAKPAQRRIVSAIIDGAVPIKVDVTSIKPSEEQLERSDLHSIATGRARWLVKSIERVGDLEILITFWSGVTVSSFKPMYVIEREVSV